MGQHPPRQPRSGKGCRFQAGAQFHGFNGRSTYWKHKSYRMFLLYMHQKFWLPYRLMKDASFFFPASMAVFVKGTIPFWSDAWHDFSPACGCKHNNQAAGLWDLFRLNEKSMNKSASPMKSSRPLPGFNPTSCHQIQPDISENDEMKQDEMASVPDHRWF